MVIGVIGASGFVGKHLIAALQRENNELRVLVHSKPINESETEVFEGDLISGEGLDKFLSRIDVVINLVGRFPPPFKKQLELNVLALDNICQTAIINNVRKLIHLSAAAAYGSAKSDKNFFEKDLLYPNTTYGLTKKMGEEVIHYYSREFGLKYVILRPPNIYGPGSDHGVIFNFLQSIKKSGRVVIYGDGMQERDFLYVDDMVEAISKAISYKASDAFNIGSGDTASLIDVVGLFEEILDRKILVEYKESQPFVVRRLAVQINKARRLLLWKPTVSLKEGLEKTIDHFDL